MDGSTGRLRLASDVQSIARLSGCAPKTLEGPAATRSGSPGFSRTRTRDLPTPHRFQANEGVDMTKSTRGPDPTDRWTRNPGVNITPLARTVPVTSTPTSA